MPRFTPSLTSAVSPPTEPAGAVAIPYSRTRRLDAAAASITSSPAVAATAGGGKKKKKIKWKKRLAECLRPEYQKEVLALQKARQEKQEDFIKRLAEEPSFTSISKGGGLAQVLSDAHQRRLQQRIKRHQALAKAHQAEAEAFNTSTAVYEDADDEEEEDEDEISNQNDPSEIPEPTPLHQQGPPTPDAWSKRHLRDAVYLPPPTQSIEEVAPLIRYTVQQRKALRDRIMDQYGSHQTQNEQLLKAYETAFSKWNFDMEQRSGGAAEASFGTTIMNELIGKMKFCELEEQRRKGHIFPDLREHIYADLTKARKCMCLAAFATLLHALPWQDQPKEIGPTYREIVAKHPKSFGREAAYFVRWEVIRLKDRAVAAAGGEPVAAAAGGGVGSVIMDYTLRGVACTFLPRPFTDLNQLTLQAAQEDSRFLPLLSSMLNGQAMTVLKTLRVSVSFIRCVEVMCHPYEYIPGRHGLMVIMKDCQGKEFTSWLLPDVVASLGAMKEKALAMLIQKSGYEGKVPMSIWRQIAADSRLYRIETSICSLTWGQYCKAMGLSRKEENNNDGDEVVVEEKGCHGQEQERRNEQEYLY